MMSLRKLVPRKVQTLVRFYSIFNKGYGHSSTRDGFCVDGQGAAVPWITYPCLEFLNNLDLGECRVFEYGAGSSTFYWSRRAKSVISVEREKDWFEKLKTNLPANCDAHLCANEARYPKVIHDFLTDFDVIVIDGAVRYACAEEALRKISAHGIIILDNTEWYPNIAELFRRNGFTQIDFAGFPPLNAFTSCTSIFFKSPELLQRRQQIPGWHPVGARFLVPHDDKPFDQIDPAVLNL